MKTLSILSVIIIMLMVGGTALAAVEDGWPLGTPNTYDNHPYILIDFEDGICRENVNSTESSIVFENDGINPWIYGCKNCNLNIYDPVNNTFGKYVVNGECGAWCNKTGNYGNITFPNGVGHVSLLTSTVSGLYINAYNSSGVKVNSSGWAEGNWGSLNFTRLSVDRHQCDIYSVSIHDSGNRWLIDDLVVASLNGDINEDGTVDTDDAMYLANYCAGISEFDDISELASDVDGNSVIDIADAAYLAKHIACVTGYEELK